MKISEAKFAGSSVRVTGKPARRLPEFAFIGRSNVGKSSLINMLCGSGKLAKTSASPGKTKVVNHFLINDSWYLVDLPGYGYARMGQEGREELRRVIGDYISNSEELTELFVLVDCRHDLGRVDREFMESLGEAGVPFSIIYTKTDKIGPNVLKARVERNGQALLEQWEELPPTLFTSSQTTAGRDELLSHIESVLKSI